MSRFGKISVAKIERDPHQPRKSFDETDLLALAENMKTFGQQVPAIVYEDGGIYRLLEGERRWRAAKLGGIEELTALLLPERPDAATLHILQMSIEVHKVSHTKMERSNLLARIRDENGWSISEMAVRLNMKQPMVTKLLSYQNLAPGIQNLLDTGGLDGEKAYAISQEPDHEKQLMLVKESAGMSREGVRARVKSNGQAAPKAKRAFFMLPDGMTVAINGRESDLEGIVEGLAALLKELRKGISQGLTVDSAQRVMKDRAKV